MPKSAIDDETPTLETEGSSPASPSMQSQPSQVVKVVEFKFCSRERCRGDSASGVHLLVIDDEIALDEIKPGAKAISYAWGEFERTERRIGHNAKGENVSLTLGEEWDTEYLVFGCHFLWCLQTGSTRGQRWERQMDI